ncbi:MAG: DUF4440 domain-containing protein [Gemmatimonadota bacterium]
MVRANVRVAIVLCSALAAGCGPGAEPPGTGSTPVGAGVDSASPAAAPAVPDGASADETALRELSARWVRGLLAGDADSVASVYSVQAEVFLPGSPELLLGQAAVREHAAERLGRRRVVAFDVQRSAFVVRPQVAYSLGVWHAVTQPAEGGPADSSTGHLTDVYRRDGSGPWVVAHEHLSLLDPRAAPDSVAAPL